MQRVVERILNLLAYLLTARRPVSAEQIRYTVAGYDQGNDEAFRRMFERDKDLLRDLGVPLRLEFTDPWQVEQGYVVHPEEYARPDPGLTDEERAALWLATGVARLGGDGLAPATLHKLGGGPAPLPDDPLGADLSADAVLLGRLFEAVVELRKVAFRYREQLRSVEPLGLVHRMGHWYLVARIGDDTRTYRVDRIGSLEVGEAANAFTRPAGFRAAAVVPDAPWEAGPQDVTAIVRFAPEAAWWARRQLPGDAVVEAQGDGSLRATLAVGSPEALVGWLVGFEDGAVIESPEALRRQFVAHVEAP